MTNSREIQETFLGGKFARIDKGYRDYNGVLEKFYVDVPVDHKPIAIYKIERHKVNVKDLEVSRLGMNSVLYEVSYRLGISGYETFIGHFIDATKDFRTLMFTHPTIANQTIGIPIMNIYSCVRVKNK